MNEKVKQEMGKSSSMTEEQIKAMMNTLVGHGVMLKELSEQIRKLPVGQSPAVKEFSTRMEELENNTKEEAMRLEKVSKDLEGTGKFLWDTAKRVEKIQTSIDDFVKVSRADFDAFVQKNLLVMSVMQSLRNDLKNHIQFFEEPREKDVNYHHFVGNSVWLTVILLFIIGVLCAVIIYGGSGRY